MNALVLLLIPVALAVSPNSRIVGGSNVNINDYRWQGSYRRGSGSHSCGCVYVGGNYALTAAHCGGGSSYTMEFGNSNRGNGPYTSIRSVLLNPSYNKGPGFSPNDISIITISGSIRGNPTAGSIPRDGSNPQTRGWITGWGKTCGTCSSSIPLKGANLDIISDSQCSSMRGSSFQSSNMICVWDTRNQRLGACSGDSGGPLSVGSTIYGVTSWGSTSCTTSLPSVYTRVGAFRSWICANSSGVRGC